MKNILAGFFLLVIISLVLSSESASAATVPTAPIGLTATTMSSSQINISWIAPSSNGGSPITGYMIERSINGGTWSTFIANTGNTTTGYPNTGLSANIVYTYRVSAINSIGTSSPSNTAAAITAFPPTNNNFVTAAQNQQYVISSSGCTDADNDGICDSWEINTPGVNGFTGLDVEYDQNGQHYSYKWPCDHNAGYVLDPGNPNSYVDALGTKVCPNPNHKDVYVEVDWMTYHPPNPGVLAAVVSAFVNSPTNNPLDNGKTGINLHIQYGETATSGNINFFWNPIKVSSASWTTRPGFFSLKSDYFGTGAERSGNDPNNQGISVINLLMAKRQVFHYAMFIHTQQETNYATSSGWAEIIGNDFVISLGTFYNGVGSTDDQEGSFMHELGHNLGLWHGGGYPPDITNPDNDNCKPNYLSVMSYTYQFASSFDPNRPLDFSNKQLSNIDENNINEQAGVDSYKYPSGAERPIFFSGPIGQQLPGMTGGTPVNWNANGVIDSGYGQILNSLTSKPACQNSYYHVLCGHNDWNSVNQICQGVTYPAQYDPATAMVPNFQSSSNSATGNSTLTDFRAVPIPCEFIPLPVADAGPDQIVNSGVKVTLDGSASTGTNLVYSWKQISGEHVTLFFDSTDHPEFITPNDDVDKTMVFMLTIHGHGQSSDTVKITVTKNTMKVKTLNYSYTTDQTYQYGSQPTTNPNTGYYNNTQSSIFNNATVINPYDNNLKINHNIPLNTDVNRIDTIHIISSPSPTIPCGETTEQSSDQVGLDRSMHITLIGNTLQTFDPHIFNSDSALQTLEQDIKNSQRIQYHGDVWAVYNSLNILQNDSQSLIVNKDALKTINQEIEDAKASYAIAGTVPEFGPVALIVLGISFISIIIIARTRINSKF